MWLLIFLGGTIGPVSGPMYPVWGRAPVFHSCLPSTLTDIDSVSTNIDEWSAFVFGSGRLSGDFAFAC